MLKSLSVVALLVLVLALLGLLRGHALFASGVVLGTAQAAAVVLVTWARLTFGIRSFHAAANPTEGGLVTTGPYAFIRHPIYAAVLLFTWAAVFSHPSARTFAAGLVVTAATAVRMIAEERLVVVRYPEYATYAARTARVIPHVF